jgi:hypothetical protein
MPFGPLDDPDRYLYHYTTWQVALGSILPSECLRFGPSRFTNDPRESKAWRFGLRGDAPNGVDLEDIGEQATRLLQQTAKLFCLTRDDPNRIGTPDEVFGRGFTHSPMWAHYAGGHSGVCLILDRKALHESLTEEFREWPNTSVYAGPVSYADYASDEIDAFTLDYERIASVGLEQAILEHFETHHAVLFFRKNEDWKGEFEYRWLVRTPSPAPEFAPIGNALDGIVIGENFPTREMDTLRYFASEYGDVPIGRLQLHTGYPDVFIDGSGGLNLRHRFWSEDARKPPPPPNLRVDLG